MRGDIDQTPEAHVSEVSLGVFLEPGRRYEPQDRPAFAALLGSGWSGIEDWGVWTCERTATLNLRIDPALRNTYGVKLYGAAFVNPQHPQIVVEAFVNSEMAVQRVLAEQVDNHVLEIPLQAIDEDGVAAIRLVVDSPMSPAALGLSDDARELGFGLEVLCLEPIRGDPRDFLRELRGRYEVEMQKAGRLLR